MRKACNQPSPHSELFKVDAADNDDDDNDNEKEDDGDSKTKQKKTQRESTSCGALID